MLDLTKTQPLTEVSRVIPDCTAESRIWTPKLFQATALTHGGATSYPTSQRALTYLERTRLSYGPMIRLLAHPLTASPVSQIIRPRETWPSIIISILSVTACHILSLALLFRPTWAEITIFSPHLLCSPKTLSTLPSYCEQQNVKIQYFQKQVCSTNLWLFNVCSRCNPF
jgi:hypothetical protein